MLKKRVEATNNLDISCISLACNTAHVLLPALQAVSKVSFVSMIDEIVKQVYKDSNKRVGLLATPSTIKYSLYQNALKGYGISTVVPTKRQIAVLEKIIRNILKGEMLASDTNKLKEIANGLTDRGADALILGCTELPLVFPKKYPLPIYNCVEILAMALLKKYYTPD